MSLQKKITLSFFISSFIIALLTTIEYINFIDIRKEIHNLEIASEMRSRSLQLRRHEKNFFLDPDKAVEEASAVYRDLEEMDAKLANYISLYTSSGRAGGLLHLLQLRNSLGEYRQRFKKIESSVDALSDQFGDTVKSSMYYRSIDPLFRLTFREHPLHAAEFLEHGSLRPPVRLIAGLHSLGSEIRNLRKNGEDIMGYTTEIDIYARGNVDHVISISKIAIIVAFPLFFISGIGTLFFVSRNLASRLKLLAVSVERTGKGQYFTVDYTPRSRWGDDEVGILAKEFNIMEAQLAQREEELRRKNEELLQSRKLAAIGTLASGVAHELANPLNNIYISAQILEKEASQSCPPIILETMHDIIGQTVRLKRIVGDLLEFARGRDLRVRDVDLKEVIMGAYKLVSATGGKGDIDFTLDAEPGVVAIEADPEQIERMFINLFSNAADAMQGATQRSLVTRISRKGDKVIITVSDSGAGIPSETLDKIFEPFYSTKDKGTGLGLAIVFNIIKKHDGEIRVESAEGKGTTFFIALPVKLRGDA